MDLAYRILWVEDNELWIDATSHTVLKVLTENELEPFIKKYLTYEEFDEDLVSNSLEMKDYDLFLIDFNLVDSDPEKNGGTLIRKIRENEIYTNVLFYSANEEILRKKIYDQKLEGVFVSDRDSGFDYKFARLVKSSIHRIQDVNFLRGFVVSEVSELECLCKEILNIILHHKHFNNFEEQCKSLLNKTKSKSEELHTKLIKKIETMENKEQEIHSIINDFDAYRMYYHIQWLWKKSTNYSNNIMLDLESYNKEILKERNKLAHSKEEVFEGKKVLKGKDNNEEVFIIDEDKFIDIRKNIKKHKKKLSSLLEVLNEK